MGIWCCKLCNYVYDPSEGDIDSGIQPGIPFEELPGDWMCPVCSARVNEFEPYAG